MLPFSALDSSTIPVLLFWRVGNFPFPYLGIFAFPLTSWPSWGPYPNLPCPRTGTKRRSWRRRRDAWPRRTARPGSGRTGCGSWRSWRSSGVCSHPPRGFPPRGAGRPTLVSHASTMPLNEPSTSIFGAKRRPQTRIWCNSAADPWLGMGWERYPSKRFIWGA